MRPRLALLLTLFILLAACGGTGRELDPVRRQGHLPDLKFSLPGAGGRQISSDDLKGKTVLLFFGYASCPDICPTTMAQLTAVLQNLATRRATCASCSSAWIRIAIRPTSCKAYVDAFNKNAIGVTGDEKQIADLARRYRVAYQIESLSPATTPRSTM